MYHLYSNEYFILHIVNAAAANEYGIQDWRHRKVLANLGIIKARRLET